MSLDVELDIDWSSQQRVALDRIFDWLKHRRRLDFYLAGYAGTGKTTLAANLDKLMDGEVLFAAYTGKAAEVLRRRGCTKASTIHSLIYRPKIETECVNSPPCKEPPCGDKCRYLRSHFVGHELNEDSKIVGAKLCIVDEASMIGTQMAKDLLSFGTPILALGDEAQLPPIGDKGFFTNRQPDFQLTEIHRQALNSPVIELATRVRQELPLIRGSYGDSHVMRGASLPIKDLLNYDQVICGTHRRRHYLNKAIRELLGYSGALPSRGEKILCLKNNHRKSLLNGTLWTVKTAIPDGAFVELTIENDQGLTVEDVTAPIEGFTSDEGNGGDLPMNPFTFGYALTCHKSQGSQWDSVLVFDESKTFRENRWRWLYTAITRVAKRVVVLS